MGQLEVRGLACGAGMLVSVLAGGWLTAQASVPSDDRDAERRGAQLAARLLRYEDTSGFRVRASLQVASPDASEPKTANLRVLGRREGRSSKTLYQIIWPRPARGYALCVERSNQAVEAGGFLFEPPDRVTPITGPVRLRTFFDSDLLIDDLIEDFWRWPLQRMAGEERVEGHATTILESRPPAGSASPYALVRSWIARTRPVRIEKFNRNGQLARRLTYVGSTRGGASGRTPARLVVEVPGATRTTTIEFFTSERDILVSAEEFAVERLERAARGED